uniref:AAA+ ATPase domain-containing protein n=1 Tax=Coccolithus braarudii TaxID=221442 RepID=A0A7S0L4E8_9EUKA
MYHFDPNMKETFRAKQKGRSRLSHLKHKASEKTIALTDHEMEVAADLVNPKDVSVTFADIGGLAEHARHLRQALLLPLRRPDVFANSRLLSPPKGILLHGPPGTGKTMLARAIASESKCTFLSLNPARLFSKWYGESNKYAEAYFSLAHKMAPSIIFIDEIDCLFPCSKKGGGGEHEATAVLRAQLLTLWDGLLSAGAGVYVVVIAATNRPAMVDPAVLRRLPLTFKVDMPTVSSRQAVLDCLLRGEDLASDIDTEKLAMETEGYSGSDLEQLCRTAALRPVQDLLASEIDGDGTDAEAVVAPVASCDAESETPDGTPSKQLLRKLVLDDFRHAMQLVLPSRGRFGAVPTPMPTLPQHAPVEPPDSELYD